MYSLTQAGTETDGAVAARIGHELKKRRDLRPVQSREGSCDTGGTAWATDANFGEWLFMPPARA
jgi:hypothetical protein